MNLVADLHRRLFTSVARRPRPNEQGAALVEYALLLMLIAVFCILAMTFLGNTAATKLSYVGQSVAGA